MLTFHSSTEIVLAVLLSTYSFSMTDRPIAWNQAAVLYPSMGEESAKPELCLMVKSLQG